MIITTLALGWVIGGRKFYFEGSESYAIECNCPINISRKKFFLVGRLFLLVWGAAGLLFLFLER
jgi:hypothetical protein